MRQLTPSQLSAVLNMLQPVVKEVGLFALSFSMLVAWVIVMLTALCVAMGILMLII